MQLIIASGNLHKVREIKNMLKSLTFLELFSLNDFPLYKPVEETGSTFEENAILKALDAAKKLGKIVLADDSGLVVPVLNGAPGIFSARFAKEGATDKENRKKLLDMMRGKKGLDRSAYFECVLALAFPDQTTKTFSARVEGMLLEEERGRHGFGYDSLFVKHDYNLTFAEIPEDTKNRISHRSKALSKLKLFLESKERSL